MNNHPSHAQDSRNDDESLDRLVHLLKKVPYEQVLDKLGEFKGEEHRALRLAELGWTVQEYNKESETRGPDAVHFLVARPFDPLFDWSPLNVK